MKYLGVTVTLVFLILGLVLIFSNPVTMRAEKKAPIVLYQVQPHYTDKALKANINGLVKLGITIKPNGEVGRVWVIKGLGYGLDEAAMTAVRKWRFVATGMQDQNTVEVKFSRLDVK